MKIKELRAKFDMTQADLAKELGVAQNTICDWETGGHCPSVKSLKMMSMLFKVSMDDIEIPFLEKVLSEVNTA